jgi:hypothetical protein
LLDTWNAVRLERILENGRTHPLIVECRRTVDAAEERGSFVLKALGLPEVTEHSLFCEAFGNQLARVFGVVTPEPVLVTISAPFATSVSPILAKSGLSISPGTGVGCEFLRGGFAPVTQSTALSELQLRQAGDLFAYDMLTQNPDRRPEKPNCGLLGKDLVAFDFEMAFSFSLLIGTTPPPWEVTKIGLASAHLMYPRLRGASTDWRPFVQRLAQLDDEILTELRSGMPAGWLGRYERVADHLRAASASAQQFGLELARCTG